MAKYLLSATVVAERLCFYICLSVILLTGGVWADTHLGRHPPGRHLSHSRQSPRQTPLLGRHPLTDTAPWADTPATETAAAADGTHPTGMHSCPKKIPLVLMRKSPNFPVKQSPSDMTVLPFLNCSPIRVVLIESYRMRTICRILFLVVFFSKLLKVVLYKFYRIYRICRIQYHFQNY